MNSIKQLMRHPFKTLCGILLVTAAVAVLCICLGQSLTAANMEANLEDLFTSVALLTDKHQVNSYYDEYDIHHYDILYHLPEEVSGWIEEAAEKYPDIIERVHRAGLASAYIPELIADNVTDHLADMNASQTYYLRISGTSYDTTYRHIMAHIKLEKLGEIVEYPDGRISQSLTGMIEQVLGLQEGYNDPTGYTARMTLILPNRAALKKLDLTVGRQYLVNGTNYTDLDWQLRCEIAVHAYGVENSWQGNEAVIPPQIEEFLPGNLTMLSDRNIEVYSNHGQNEVYQVAYYIHDETQEDGSIIQRCINLTNLDMDHFRSVSFVMNGTGGEPTIVPLEGAAEEFLSGGDGAIWQKYLDYIPVNNHAFAVIGVDDLMGVGDFALSKAYITQGRNFTPEELAKGEKVCIVSEQVAALNDLKVGDAISPQFYSYDYDPIFQQYVSEGVGVINPGAYLVGPGTQMQEAESYTIVGLYAKDVPWQGANSMYEFTCNTIFAPKASITSEMDYGDLGIFQSIIIKNGMLEEFEEIAIRDGHDGQFEVTDQGYENVKNGLHNYQKVANQALVIGTVVYFLILALFLALFPGQQGKSLKLMASMGAKPVEKLGYLMVSALGILIPGSIVGLLLGTLMWDQVVGSLMESVRVILAMELNIPMLAGIMAVHLGFAAVLTLVVCLPQIRSRSLMVRRNLFGGLADKIKRTPLKGSTIVMFALIISMVLCGLNAANEAEYASYEESYHSTPVKVTLVSLYDHDEFNLGAGGHERDLFADERFAKYTPQKYLKDIQLMSSMWASSINEETFEVKFTGIDSLPEDVSVQWMEEYGPEILGSGRPFVIIPESWILSDCDKYTQGIQLEVEFAGVVDEIPVTCNAVVTVAGTHDGDNGIFSPKSWLLHCGEQIGKPAGLSLLNGTVTMRESDGESISGITSQVNPLNLSAQRKCVITWNEGFDADCLNGDIMVVLVPETRAFKDMDPKAAGTQILLKFSNSLVEGFHSDGTANYRIAEYESLATVAGTYSNSISSQNIYCPYEAITFCGARVSVSLALDHISATMNNNDEINGLREMADQWFADPDKELDLTKKFTYALDIDDSVLDNLKTTLENNILINQICTMLVFILTAGAGFFLGFLMVRSRKREIILMRTLGKPNSHIYRDFALEQMLWVLVGIMLGGAVFLWKPLSRLALLALIYFAGLSAALLIFLRSTLLTTIKEDE